MSRNSETNQNNDCTDAKVKTVEELLDKSWGQWKEKMCEGARTEEGERMREGQEDSPQI